MMKIKTTLVLAGCGLALATSATAQVGQAPAPLPKLSSIYPKESLALKEEGTVGYRVEVSREGKLDSCEVVKSSGFQRLDTATCEMLMISGRFKPGLSSDGRRIRAKYDGQIVWKLPSTS